MRRRNTPRLGITFIALAALATSAAACSSSSGSSASSASPGSASTVPVGVQAELNGLSSMSASARQSFLVSQAEKEGKVVFYSSLDPDEMQAWASAFNKAYPKVNLQIVRMTTAEVLQRAVAESQAHKPVASLYIISGTQPQQMEQDNMLAKYTSPQSQGFSSDDVDAGGLFTTVTIDPLVNGYNTTKVKQSQVPTTIQGLTNPGLKGKLGTTTADGPLWLGAVYKALGATQGAKVAQQVAANHPSLFSSNTELANALTSGQVPIAFNVIEATVITAKKKGAPVSFVPTEPMMVFPLDIAIAADAPDPYAAALVYDWTLSETGGQQVVAQFDDIGPRTDMTYPGQDVITNAKQVIPFSPAVESNPTQLNSTFTSLFGQ
jgi:iron(III) transport system substrate-binding protein